ncbi:NAD+ dependent glucose-6-phosphate dehydrogenase [Motilibacter peucedani]|uniref:NAD+ dependent glucose-6-phosphate dehydrogenase n=1 Tax=Motilibacter peucedani TaxID=598650 RepID=A0A420XLU4_9ACTN|nr:NAD(P)-dependent oxidoreductase [Motilibacter peucedani]RKS71386.1 NAD+ dependent glucose-6-phosphate dehydrogenase [Motilibacter peucedani]
MSARTVLVTGAGGSVAGQLLPGLAHHYDLRLTDREVPTGRALPGPLVVGDLGDPEVLEEAVDGVHAVVHLAGDPRPDAPWDSLEHSNVDTFRSLLEGARRAHVGRVVYASSIHAMGQYESDGQVPVNPLWPPAPCCAYGATKAFDEALARVYSRRAGLSTIGLRLGATRPEPVHAGQLAAWLGPSDLQQLVRRSLETQVHFGVYFGVSANTRQHFDAGNARHDLGYAPILDSERYAATVAPGEQTTTCLLR